MANDINKEDPHYKGEYGSIYEVNRKFPTGGVAGDFVVIDGWAHYWNADRATWCVNAERDSYWDELITNIIEKFKLVRGATYMGVASLDTVPAKAIGAKMYYFATVAGTYKNFGDLVVPQGINVLYSENGSSWVNTTLLEVAQELGVSTNKVVSQKTLNDALAKKFDKDSVVQESGEAEDKVMSQKAVSDKLSDLADEFKTQLCESGIVVSKTNPLSLCGFIDTTSGEIVDNKDDNWKSSGYIYAKGATLNVKIKGQGTDIVIIACYDANLKYLKESSVIQSTYSGSYEVPQGVSFVRFSGKIESCEVSVISGKVLWDFYSSYGIISAKINEQSAKINEQNTKIEDNARSIKTQLCESGIVVSKTNPLSLCGFIDTTSGEIVDNKDDNWKSSGYIYAKGATLNVKIKGQGTDIVIIACYDANLKYLKESSVIQSTYSGSYEVPQGVSFVRFSGKIESCEVSVISGKVLWDFYSSYGIISAKINEQSAKINEQNTKIEDNARSIKTINENLKDIIKSETAGYKYDVNHFISYGQSLSQGDWAGNVVSTIQKYNSIMFTGTIRVWENRNQATIYDNFVPAVENVFKYNEGETVVGATVRGETPCCGTAEMAMNLIKNENGFDFEKYGWRILVSAPGMGGYSIANLSKGTSVYNRLLRDVENGKRIANNKNQSYACLGISWLQGETDSKDGAMLDSYYQAMEKLFTDLNTDIKTITGQEEDVHFFLYQTDCCHFYGKYSYPYVSLAQLKISLSLPNVHMVSPIYFLPKLSDNTHFTAEGSKWFGGYCGIAFKKVVLDGEDFNPIHIESAFVQGNNIFVQFYVPNPPLIFDTENVIDRGVGKGFQIRNPNDTDNNSYLDIITAVEIIRPNMIKISCSESPFGKKLTYAVSNAKSYGIESTFIGGNLRDSQTTKFTFNVEGESKEHYMYNWCPILEYSL